MKSKDPHKRKIIVDKNKNLQLLDKTTNQRESQEIKKEMEIQIWEGL